IATKAENREKLYARGRSLLRSNLEIMQAWVEGLGAGYEFTPPTAGAICFIRYPGAMPSADLCERLRIHQSTLIVPGEFLGLEGYVRIWMGAKPDYLREGLRRVEIELGKALEFTPA
ncbi:MAG: hypothetical protein P8Y44_10855, partial [Acidobacteriota bacterium]